MSKVWMRTKYDNEMQMDIPHHIDFANAMYGFREMGAEIIPYHTISEIVDWVTREDIVLDYIAPCRYIFNKFGVDPYLDYYPEVLKPFLGRKIWRDTINNFSKDEEKWSKGYFIKPIKEKAFTGKIVRNIADLVGCGSCYEDYEILVSEPIEVVGEWRCFIRYDGILEISPYGWSENYIGFQYHYDWNIVNRMLEAFSTWEERPAACSMDICVTKDGRTLLVECNDAYALGCYGLPDIYYAKLISARWSQLLNHVDEYNFHKI